MMSRLILILFALTAQAIFACSDSPDDPGMITDNDIEPPEIIQVGMMPPELYRDGVTSMAEISARSKESSIDPDDYEIIFKDIYNDFFYLNKTDEATSQYLYRGKWESNVWWESEEDGVYDVIAVYDNVYRILNIVAHYKDNNTFSYTVIPNRYINHTFIGKAVYHIPPSPYYSDFEPVWIDLTKGELKNEY